MSSMVTFLGGIYFLIVIAVVVYLLYMISRSVKALEKIAEVFERKSRAVE